MLPPIVHSQEARGRVGVEAQFGQMPFESQTSLSGTSHKRTFLISYDILYFACELKKTLDNDSGEQESCGEADIDAGGLWVSWW